MRLTTDMRAKYYRAKFQPSNPAAADIEQLCRAIETLERAIRQCADSHTQTQIAKTIADNELV